MLNKKGDVNWFIVSLIIVILSFAVIVLVLVRFNFTSGVDRAACTESAIFRGAITEKLDAKDLVSLNCKTKRICVTTNKVSDGDCDSGLGSKFVTYRVSGTNEEISNSIKMVLAREMAECWNTLGEGNLQIFNREIGDKSILNFLGNPFNGKIIVCSRVMFDESITNRIPSVSGMNNYLLSHKVPGKQISYWDYLRNANDGDTLQMINGDPIVGADVQDDINLAEQKAIFYLESSPTQMGEAIGAVAGTAATTLLLGSFNGAGFKGVSVLGRISGLGTISSNLLIYGGVSYYSGKLADTAFRNFVAPGLEDSSSVSGVFLTDYSIEGFRNFENQNIGFENIP